ncbi:MAG: PAS domain-containing protein [Acidimicrobiales bacterium]
MTTGSGPLAAPEAGAGEPGAVVVADRGGIITAWDEGATAMFGWGQDEAVGQTLDLIVPERFRARHWEGYRGVMETGRTRYGGGQVLAVPATRRDGARLSIEFTVALETGSDGRVEAIRADVRDVTADWEARRAGRDPAGRPGAPDGDPRP